MLVSCVCTYRVSLLLIIQRWGSITDKIQRKYPHHNLKNWNFSLSTAQWYKNQPLFLRGARLEKISNFCIFYSVLITHWKHSKSGLLTSKLHPQLHWVMDTDQQHIWHRLSFRASSLKRSVLPKLQTPYSLHLWEASSSDCSNPAHPQSPEKTRTRNGYMWHKNCTVAETYLYFTTLQVLLWDRGSVKLIQ